ncbi:MAG: alcohol dehydrogenase [Planctomycetes bacterium]|jgi:threonine dehydrogenase-like Zn-dependent dehydrogenase|nr:alcohol dehydrogenase [Planctomycetota bacterium]
MRALTFQAPRAISLESIPDPRIEHPRDVVLRMQLGAICGSDLHVYRGHETGLDVGTVLGHEFLGEIVEVGAEVETWKAGDRAVSPFSSSCGSCSFCSCGLTSRCSNGAVYGWVAKGEGLQGAQAEYIRVPFADASLVAVPDDHPAEEVLLIGDILSTAYFCAENGGVQNGTSTCVLGCGPVGLLAIQAARELGAAPLIAVDAVPERLELAERFGALPVSFERDDPHAFVARHTDGRGVELVLEVVGNAAAGRLAYDLVRPGGTISAAGVHNEEHFPFSPGAAYDKNLTYKAGRAPARHYMERMLGLLRKKRLDISPLLSHRLPLGETVRGYEIFDNKLEGAIKVLIEP